MHKPPAGIRFAFPFEGIVRLLYKVLVSCRSCFFGGGFWRFLVSRDRGDNDAFKGSFAFTHDLT